MTHVIVLKGKVVSGSGRGKMLVGLPWVKEQINEKLGFNPYLGTLNLRLPKETAIDELCKASGIMIVPEEGYFEGKCFKAVVNGKIEGAVILPDVPEYPSDLLEVLAPVNLRKTIGLKDAMMVEVIISVE